MKSPPDSPARVLYTAKNRLGEQAVRAAREGKHEQASRFAALAVEADALARKVVEEMAK